MKYCGTCGQQADDDAGFCQFCGCTFVRCNDATAALHSDGTPSGPSEITLGKVETGIQNNVFISPVTSSDVAASFNSPLSRPPEVEEPIRVRKVKIIIGSILTLIFMAAGGFWGWQNYGTEARSKAKLELAVKYLSENDYEKAILAFNDAINIDPQEVKAYQGLARTYTIQGKYDDAKFVYDKGLAAVAAEKKQTLQIGLAGMYIDQGQLDKADQAFQELMNINNKCLEAYWGLAMVYQQKGDNSKAEAILRKAVENNPTEYRAYNTLALYFKQNNKADDALNSLVKSLSLEMNQQEAYLVLSDMYKGRWTELQSKLPSVSDQQVAAMMQFYSYYTSEDYQKAVNIYKEKFSKQTSNQTSNQKVRILAGIAMLKLGDKSGAESLSKQLNLEQLNSWLLSDIANYYMVAGDKEKAKDYAIKALEANPANLDAIALLQTFNSNDTTAKIYAAKDLLYNWKPVSKVKKDIQTGFNTNTVSANTTTTTKTYVKTLKPGCYISCNVNGPCCGLRGEDGKTIGSDDDVTAFKMTSHNEAAFLWFTSGSLTWDYPVSIPIDSQIQVLSYTAEIASEYVYYDEDWPSDVTLNINDMDIGTWTIPGDPGKEYAKQRNHLGYGGSQYGWLTTWTIDQTGSYLEYKFRSGDMAKKKVSGITINDLYIQKQGNLRLKLSVPNKGDRYGLNLFGSTWGDYGKNPAIKITYIDFLDVSSQRQ